MAITEFSDEHDVALSKVLETDILAVISSNDSAGNVAVRVGTLKAEGTSSSGSTGRIFDARV